MLTQDNILSYSMYLELWKAFHYAEEEKKKKKDWLITMDDILLSCPGKFPVQMTFSQLREKNV